jgi:hypothetical protein
LELPYNFLDLVNTFPGAIGVAVLIFSTEMPPWEAIYRSEITLGALCKTQVVKKLP